MSTFLHEISQNIEQADEILPRGGGFDFMMHRAWEAYYQKGEIQMKLSDGEWKIIQLLWKESPQTIIQLTKNLDSETGWTKHTVISYLKRMEEKGAVRYQTEGRTKQFYPLIEERDAELQETKDFLDKVFQGKLGLLLHTMVEQRDFTEDEIEELQSILDHAKKV